jgi:hypothetical protein
MRRICFILLVIALTVPTAALAGDRAVGDGSLVVTNASGTIIVQGKGLIFGHVDQGTLVVLDYRPDGSSAVLTVNGARGKIVRSGTSTGNDVRFLLPSGRYTIELVGTGIDVSAVGKGLVSVTGAGTSDDGSFTVNGGKQLPLTKGSASQLFGAKSS